MNKRSVSRVASKFGWPYLMAAVAVMGLAARTAAKRNRRIDFRGKVVAIMGGSRGLGLEIARQLAAQGARLALMARDLDELQRAEQELLPFETDVLIQPCDVRDQHQVEQTLARIVRRYSRLDVLINNAGIIQVGPLEHMALKDFEDAMDTHFWGPLMASLAATAYMRQQGSGRIVNISSIGGRIAVPHMLPYTASKFALTGLSDGLRAELAPYNIQVTTVIPGLMRTGSHVNALFKGRHRQEYTWFSISDALPFTSINSAAAAHQIIEACRYGQPSLIITPQARLAVVADALAPGLVAGIAKLAARLMPRPEPRWGDLARTGLESRNPLSPSVFTSLADRKVEENNEVP